MSEQNKEKTLEADRPTESLIEQNQPQAESTLPSEALRGGLAEFPNERDRRLEGFRLPSAVHAIAWSTGAAAITWLAACLGQTYLKGRYDALGLDALSLPAVDQGRILIGVGAVLQSAIDVILALIVVRIVYSLLRWGARRIGSRFHLSLPKPVTRRLWWLLLALVFADAAIFFGGMKELQKQGTGMILKSTAEVGDIWTRVVFDTDQETVAGLEIVYGGGLALFVGLSWWLVNDGFKSSWAKIAFSLYAVAGTFSFLFGYAYLEGMADTVRNFPVVAFSSLSESDRGYIFFLLGEDDKMFALLDIKLNDQMEVESRYVAYFPRFQVKWLSVIHYMPIYRAADVNDLVRLAKQAKSGSQ